MILNSRYAFSLICMRNILTASDSGNYTMSNINTSFKAYKYFLSTKFAKTLICT